MTDISVIGCGWLGLPLAVRLKRMELKVCGSTTSDSKIEVLRNRGIEPFLLKLNPSDNNVPESLFDVEYAIINIPPRNTDEDNSFHIKQLTFLKTKFEKFHSKVIFISSTGIYPALSRVVTETDADPKATSRGGVVLKDAEDVFLNSCCESTIIRFGGLYGPGRHPVNYLSGKKVKDGDAPVNMIHQEDCIRIIMAIIKQSKWNEVYNACSPFHPTKKEFYQDAANRLSIEPPMFSEIEKEKTPFKIVSSEKLISGLNYGFIH